MAGTSPDLTFSHFALRVDAEGKTAGVSAPVRLPLELDFSPYQVFPSPDGRYLVLMQAVEPGGRPYVVNQATGQIKEPFDWRLGGGKFFGWHPDGRRFLFWIDSVALWLVDAETFETTTLALPRSPVQGAIISPDGLTVAYIAENRPVLGSLWLVSSAGSDAKPLFDAGTISYLYPGAWSPDGTHIVYYGNCAPPDPTSGQLCLYSLQSGEHQVIRLPFLGFSPAWSPDSRYLAATGLSPDDSPCEGGNLSASEQQTCREAASSIYIADIVTGEVRKVTAGIMPAWSPDGSMLAFISHRSRAPEVWAIRADGAGLQQLTTDGQAKRPELSWSREAEK